MTYGKKLHPLGFWQADPLPTQEELQKYYSEVYFQNCTSTTYSPDYTPGEKAYFRSRAVIAERIWQCHALGAGQTLCDVGCGEGFFAAYFAHQGWSVRACDFSSFGIEKHNPLLVPFFAKGDIYATLESASRAEQRFGLVNLSNVLEHVRDPQGLLGSLKAIMAQGSLLRVCVPNDFSAFQALLLRDEDIKSETWFSPPDHLNYFTFASLASTLEACGFEVTTMTADFPIELYLLNGHSNYWVDREKGKSAHKARVRFENFLVEEGLDTYIDYMSAAARAGIGRSVIAYARLGE